MDLLFFLGLLIFKNCAYSSSEILIQNAACIQNTVTLLCERIPTHVPDNVTHILLRGSENVEEITHDHLNGSNWEKVKYLQIFNSGSEKKTKSVQGIKPFALKELRNLVELRIISLYFYKLYRNSFAGLDTLRVLNFTGCEYLIISTITKAITGVNTLPNLEVLSMTYLSTYNDITFDEAFFNALAPKPIKLLDVHQMSIKEKIADQRYIKGILDTVQYINMSGTTWSIGVFSHSDISVRLDNLKLLDVSYTVFPKAFLSWLQYLPIMLGRSYNLSIYYLTVISNVETIDASGINNQKYPVEIINFTVYLKDSEYSVWLLKNLIMKHNNLKYLDVTFPCIKSNLESFDFSFNIIEFLQPKFCPCCKKLAGINLSHNKLGKMLESNYSLFAQLVWSYPNLRYLQLSSNQLTTIPHKMFNKSNKLEEIDLSDNLLEKVIFSLQHLDNLKLLNLQNNRISILNQESRTNLQSLFISNKTKQNASEILQMNNNPISCAECHTLPSVKWLLETPIVGNVLVCKNQNGVFIPVDQSAARSVQEECDKPVRIRNIILISTLGPVLSIMLIACIVLNWRRYQKRKRYERNMEQIIRQIQRNELETKFVVFLSFSSYDYFFLNNYVYRPLKEHLRQKTGTERDLICIGDKNFQLGKPINDEMVICLQQSAVVLLLLSHHFCDSEFCRMEFDHALHMKKPIILMVKEEVDENEMVPSLQELFKRNTRILWERQGNNYHLKTSWENVCNSILELAQ